MIAKIRVVANVSNVSSTQNQVQTAKIALDNQERLYKRQKTLFDKGVISANDFDAAQLAYKQAKQNYVASKQGFDIVKTGTTSGLGNYANTLIRSTVNGMVLDVPVKVGNQVIESNNFNEGTTIASVADVGRMIFVGKIDESEVGKIKENINGYLIAAVKNGYTNVNFEKELNLVLQTASTKLLVKGACEVLTTSTMVHWYCLPSLLCAHHQYRTALGSPRNTPLHPWDRKSTRLNSSHAR